MRIRDVRPDDLPGLVALFHGTVRALGAGHYTPQELAAWAPADLDPEDWRPRLARNTALVAEEDGALLGFAELSPEGAVDMLYVHPAAAGQGVGSMLIDALERLAGGRGVSKLNVDASDSARGFFEKRGYAAQQRNSVSVGDEWLANTTMQKQLAAKREVS